MARVRNLVAAPATAYDLTVVDVDPLRAAICAAGELDLAARRELTAVLRAQQDAGRRFVRLDLSAVELLDCACLGVLVGAHHRFLDLQGLLVLTGVDGSVAQVLKLTGLEDTLFVVPTDQDPFGSVLMERASRRREAQRPDVVPSNLHPLVAVPDQRDPGELPPARAVYGR